MAKSEQRCEVCGVVRREGLPGSGSFGFGGGDRDSDDRLPGDDRRAPADDFPQGREGLAIGAVGRLDVTVQRGEGLRLVGIEEAGAEWRLGGRVFDGTAVTEFAIGQVHGDVIGGGFDAAGAMEPPEGFGWCEERIATCRTEGRSGLFLPFRQLGCQGLFAVGDGYCAGGGPVLAGEAVQFKSDSGLRLGLFEVPAPADQADGSGDNPGRTSAVMDLGGKVGEWRRNEYGKLRRVQWSGAELRVLRVRRAATTAIRTPAATLPASGPCVRPPSAAC